MQTIQQLIERLKITIEVESADPSTSPWAEDHEDHFAYTVTLRRPEGQQLVTPFQTGTGWDHEPEVPDVLSSLALDASGVRNTQGFEDWCSEYGFDSDSRKAYATYQATETSTRDLAQFMGDELDELLYETEQL